MQGFSQYSIFFFALFITEGLSFMYKFTDRSTISFFDFDQPAGMHMNPNNCWIKLADSIPWDDLEQRYASLFSSHTGNVAKPFR